MRNSIDHPMIQQQNRENRMIFRLSKIVPFHYFALCPRQKPWGPTGLQLPLRFLRFLRTPVFPLEN